jgi:hypothetical protein
MHFARLPRGKKSLLRDDAHRTLQFSWVDFARKKERKGKKTEMIYEETRNAGAPFRLLFFPDFLTLRNNLRPPLRRGYLELRSVSPGLACTVASSGARFVEKTLMTITIIAIASTNSRASVTSSR